MSAVVVNEHSIAVTDPARMSEIAARALSSIGSGKGADLTCPCGKTHHANLLDYAASVGQDLGSTVEVSTTEGTCYLVSRLYILAHGVRAQDLPALARQGLITVKGGPQA